jgi:L-asparaginase / beta-aspartyl-peptidase
MINRPRVVLAAVILVFTALTMERFMSDMTSAQEPTAAKSWAIVLHGGVGTLPADMPQEQVEAYRQGLREALLAGRKVLVERGTSLAAVEATIKVLEDNPLFNAGRGAVFNSAGGHELDASIMDGHSLDGGAVAGVTTVKNPIGLARLVMQHTRHVLLAGEGAEQFATEMEVARVENQYFSTEAQRANWQRVRDSEKQRETKRIEKPRQWHYGTVGCVALDDQGNLAAGTSTGGLTNKKFGRVGDSPIIGAGTYAANSTCGVSASGVGEQFIRHAVAAQVSLLMEHRQWSLRQAAAYVVQEKLRQGDGGIIAIDRQGGIVWEFNTPGMFRAAADSEGLEQVLIRDEEK